MRLYLGRDFLFPLNIQHFVSALIIKKILQSISKISGWPLSQVFLKETTPNGAIKKSSLSGGQPIYYHKNRVCQGLNNRGREVKKIKKM